MRKQVMDATTDRIIARLFKGYEAELSHNKLHMLYGQNVGILNTLWSLELITDAQYDTLSERNYTHYSAVLYRATPV